MPFRPFRPIIQPLAGYTAKAKNRNQPMKRSKKTDPLDQQKKELEIENLKADLVYKKMKIKALAWGIFFSGITLITKLKN